MAQAKEVKYSALSNCESYFERIQSTKKLPKSLQETLNDAFARIPVSSFPGVPGGKGNDEYQKFLQFQNFVHMFVHKKLLEGLKK